MRVIAGKYRGLKLAEFSYEGIRPTADRVKESLFNILAAKTPNASVLDLFCGSGNLGIECLSRGAQSVHFNDLSSGSLAVLNKNLSRLKDSGAYKITNLDFAICLKAAKDSSYDLIFIDPPYRLEAGVEALKIIGANRILKTGGVAVLERDRPFTGLIDGLKLYDERKYGKTYLSFFTGVI